MPLITQPERAMCTETPQKLQGTLKDGGRSLVLQPPSCRHRHSCGTGETMVGMHAVPSCDEAELLSFLLGSKVDFYHWNSLEIHLVNVGHQLPSDDRAYVCQQLLFNYNITPGPIGTSCCRPVAERMWVRSWWSWNLSLEWSPSAL